MLVSALALSTVKICRGHLPFGAITLFAGACSILGLTGRAKWSRLYAGARAYCGQSSDWNNMKLCLRTNCGAANGYWSGYWSGSWSGYWSGSR
jgi:hypothetical protein